MSIDTQKAVNLLMEKGYSAYVENGVVYIKNSDPDFRMEDFAELLHSLDYKCSYGMKLQGPAAENFMSKTGMPASKRSKKNISCNSEEMKEESTANSEPDFHLVQSVRCQLSFLADP